MKKAIIVLYELGWSEVDWIIPIIFKIKQIRPDLNIISIFSLTWIRVNRNRKENTTLQKELQSISDHIIYSNNYNPIHDNFQALKNFHITGIIKIDLDTELSNAASKAFPNAKVITHGGGLTVYVPQRINHPRSFNIWQKSTCVHDVRLVDSIFGIETRFRYASNEKVCGVGYPRLDQWWVDRLLSIESMKDSMEYSIASSGKRIFSLFTRSLSINFPPEHYAYVYRSVAEVILSDKNNFLIIKPHPLYENILFIQKLFENFDKNQWMISSLQAIQIASLSQLMITVMSGCVFDGLAVNKPVIEFNPTIQPTQSMCVDQHGRYQSRFSVIDLAVLVRNKEELINAIDSFFNPSKSKDVWIKQQKAFRNLCPVGDNASERAAKVILNLSEPESMVDKNLPPIQMVWSPVNNEKQLFLLDNDSPSLYLQIKNIFSIAMPINSILMKEIAQFFHSEIFVATGRFREHLAILASKYFNKVHCIEVAADLYQAVSMQEIQQCQNINIYTSANVLKSLLSKHDGNIVFWLETNETSLITNKSQTNFPIIEELKIILESNIKNPIILINNLRYFQPIVTTHIEANGNKERKYPELQEAIDIIMQLKNDYKCAVLGDILIAYPSEYTVTISQAVYACTVSRIFNGQNIPFKHVQDAEEYISTSLPESEKVVLRNLYQRYDSFEEPGVGGHYHYWKALILFGEKCYHEANHHFLEALNRGCNHWRVGLKYAQSALKTGDLISSKKMLEQIIKIEPNCNHAFKLLNEINQSVNNS